MFRMDVREPACKLHHLNLEYRTTTRSTVLGTRLVGNLEGIVYLKTTPPSHVNEHIVTTSLLRLSSQFTTNPNSSRTQCSTPKTNMANSTLKTIHPWLQENTTETPSGATIKSYSHDNGSDPILCIVHGYPQSSYQCVLSLPTSCSSDMY
jgi:hypothetical protein